LGGDPVQVRVCASKSWSVYSACKNLRAHHGTPPRGGNTVSQKTVHLDGSISTSITLFICGPKFTSFFSPNVGGVLVDFRFSICGSVPEIFAIKVENCQKLRRILDVFLDLPNFRGQAFQKLYPRYHLWLATRRLDKNL